MFSEKYTNGLALNTQIINVDCAYILFN